MTLCSTAPGECLSCTRSHIPQTFVHEQAFLDAVCRIAGGIAKAGVVGVTFPAKAYPALDLHSLEFLFMNKRFLIQGEGVHGGGGVV